MRLGEMRRGRCATESFTAETQRAQRKPSSKATAARFDGAKQGPGGAEKADLSGKRRLRDDNFFVGGEI